MAWYLCRARRVESSFCELKQNRFTCPRAADDRDQRKMILTNCAACAAPLAHNAPRCVRCQTRYCNKTCQHEAARELGTEDATVLTLRINYASALISEGRSRDDLVEAVALLEELSSTARRVFGTAHPTMMTINGNLESARSKLASFAAAP